MARLSTVAGEEGFDLVADVGDPFGIGRGGARQDSARAPWLPQPHARVAESPLSRGGARGPPTRPTSPRRRAYHPPPEEDDEVVVVLPTFSGVAAAVFAHALTSTHVPAPSLSPTPVASWGLVSPENV